MTLVADTSIPFPFDAPDAWDRLVLRGVSGKLYTWPVEMRGHGNVKIKMAPPKPRTKTSAKAGAAKPRTKDVGKSLGKASVDFEVTDKGWPTFVDLWRLLSEERDGPYRLLHPTADTFDMRSFKVAEYPEITDTIGGITRARASLEEIDPETQAGNGASAGVNTPGAKAYAKAEQDDFIADQLAIAKARISALAAETRHDLNVKNGQKQEARSIEKAVAYGKATP